MSHVNVVARNVTNSRDVTRVLDRAGWWPAELGLVLAVASLL